MRGQGDPALDFEDVLFVRGSFDGWSDPPRPTQQFVNLGGGQYQAGGRTTARSRARYDHPGPGGPLIKKNPRRNRGFDRQGL